MDQLYKYFRWLSLDIVLGAIFFLAYLEKYYQVQLSLNVYFALGSAIWLIYTADHLIDARSVKIPSNERHLFHQNYFRQLVFFGGTILMLSLMNIYFLDFEIIKNGSLLAAICVGYLLLVYLFKRLWMKELIVALAYAFGIFLAPISLDESLDWIDVVLISQLAFVALLNLIVFSYYDFMNDHKDGFNSIVLRVGKRKAHGLILILSIGLMTSCMCMYSISNESIQLLYLLMTSVLAVVYFFPVQFSLAERFRIVGDGVFYFAALFLLF